MARPPRHYDNFPAGVPHTPDVPERNLFSSLEVSAGKFPEKTAVDYYGCQISFRALLEASLMLAGYMQQRLGVRRGDRVLLWMQNCPQFAIAYYAILRCDAVVVAMNPISTPEEAVHYVADTGGRVVIAMQDMLSHVAPLLDNGALVGCIVGAYSEFARPSEAVPFMAKPDIAREPRVPLSASGLHEFAGALAAGIAPTPMRATGQDPAVIAYTAGTTGTMFSHSAFAHVVSQQAPGPPNNTDSTDLVILQVCYAAGL